jgi:hypothetical protein
MRQTPASRLVKSELECRRNERVVAVRLIVELLVHWQGGDHTRLTIKKNRAVQTRWATGGDTTSLIDALSEQIPDKSIGAALDWSGKQLVVVTPVHE